MRTHARTALAGLCCAMLPALLSCRSAGKVESTAARARPESQTGTFRFLERVGESAPVIVLEGILTVTADTIELDLSPGPCRYDEQSAGSSVIRYRCADVSISID